MPHRKNAKVGEKTMGRDTGRRIKGRRMHRFFGGCPKEGESIGLDRGRPEGDTKKKVCRKKGESPSLEKRGGFRRRK